MPTKVQYEGRKVIRRGRLNGYVLQAAPGATGTLGSYDCDRSTFPELRSLAYDGDASGTGYVEFSLKINGQHTPFPFSRSYNSLGEEGRPVDVNQPVPPGAKVEVCYAVSASLPVAGVDLFSDGFIEEFDAPEF